MGLGLGFRLGLGSGLRLECSGVAPSLVVAPTSDLRPPEPLSEPPWFGFGFGLGFRFGFGLGLGLG